LSLPRRIAVSSRFEGVTSVLFSAFVPLYRKILASSLLLLFVALLIVPMTWAADDFVTYPLLATDYRSIKVFDNRGRFVGRLLAEQRYWTPLSRIPLFLQQAVVAVEDTRFYEHGGIDVRGIARALVKDVINRNLAQGGSTITQQLIKNRYLSGEKTIDRKVKEGFMAVEYEKKYSKAQILEMYFNEIYYGNGAWGIAAAARLYFDKNPEELNDAECALLAGVPKNPGRYNPAGESASVNARRDVVLKRMADLEIITAQKQQQLRAQRVTVTPRGQAPYYLNHIRSKLIERYGAQVIEDGRMEITAALDLDLQKLAEKTLREKMQGRDPALQGALVNLDPATGNILAAVGGIDFAKSSYNRAFFAQRQPGSAIKPLIFATALEAGYTASDIWDDTPVAYSRGDGKSWTPRNYGNETFGALSLRQALAHSNNVITVKLLEAIGVQSFVDFAGQLGLPLRARHDLSLALGTEEVTLVELVQAYAPFANSGLQPELRTILRIVDRQRNEVTEFAPILTPVVDPAAAYVTTSMLQDVLKYGTAKSLANFSQQRPAAGKTGTTDDYRDAWFIGYTPQLVTGVWVGYDQPKPGGRGFTGGAICAPIWEGFMRSALAGKEAVDFVVPESVVSVNIDPVTGYIATTDCPQTYDEVYIAGTEPTLLCPEHGGDPLPPEPPRPESDVNAESAGAEFSWDNLLQLFSPNQKSEP
jgi:1A family penicillin-binding protein